VKLGAEVLGRELAELPESDEPEIEQVVLQVICRGSA
jgi:hypothetical protein